MKSNVSWAVPPPPPLLLDRLLIGEDCHEHFLTQTYPETHLQKTCEAYEWLNFFDKLLGSKYYDHIGEAKGYMPFCAQGFHELFAQEKGEAQHPLERKKESYEVHPQLFSVRLMEGIREAEAERGDYEGVDGEF
jgi:hypothetical protein